jgi:hypothetical protein
MTLREQQVRLLRALHSDDPIGALRELLPDLADRVDPAGFHLSSLLVRKLRFGNILRGDRGAQARFRLFPGQFVETFRAYAREVPPTAYFPPEEKALFWSFVERGGGGGS